MTTNAKQVADRIEGVLASDQWAAILKSTSGRMRLGDTTSFKLKEELDQGNLSLVFNYELGKEGLFLSTYDGKFISGESVQKKLGDKARSGIERTFNAAGSYVFSLQEAINLLEGRSVLKSYVSMDGVEKNGWFKAENGAKSKDLQFFFSGGQVILPNYDLGGVLKKLPMAAGNFVQNRELIRSLQYGDLQAVKLTNNAEVATCFIQADPASKSALLFDETGRRMEIPQLTVDGSLVNTRRHRDKGLSMG
ncbi:hypothetical protein SAMN05192529_10961 [Arachidicoccus rhizosphaerae]|uniref:Uncharacterized protein n=1 Tax=Arachidicoccus rhizosphaerae TaxID=551991 RepID=A0A1H3YUD9_9BACT|nr:hypothetical protein [Arachidicoccus rhizosphaerae]SEA15169.1 hypothetical protein SAMN05192529_10961 [Arachidicoccus rhizosphaerae]